MEKETNDCACDANATTWLGGSYFRMLLLNSITELCLMARLAHHVDSTVYSILILHW